MRAKPAPCRPCTPARARTRARPPRPFTAGGRAPTGLSTGLSLSPQTIRVARKPALGIEAGRPWPEAHPHRPQATVLGKGLWTPARISLIPLRPLVPAFISGSRLPDSLPSGGVAPSSTATRRVLSLRSRLASVSPGLSWERSFRATKAGVLSSWFTRTRIPTCSSASPRRWR